MKVGRRLVKMIFGRCMSVEMRTVDRSIVVHVVGSVSLYSLHYGRKGADWRFNAAAAPLR